ncbi:hypothetical protein [Streptomyces sp. YGL11-2]|uniref:hypothetical protein n=1 Tax=Streptomyces sp. YGL11-2 TaxID=3414028 RepID=UPI003CED9606
MQLLMFGSLFGFLSGLGGWVTFKLLHGSLWGVTLVWTPVIAVRGGFLCAFGAGIGAVPGLTAWGQWVALARIWLPLTGRLPWRVMAFLEDAHQQGVLRQAGEVYQFRHTRLQDHLVRSPELRDR